MSLLNEIQQVLHEEGAMSIESLTKFILESDYEFPEGYGKPDSGLINSAIFNLKKAGTIEEKNGKIVLKYRKYKLKSIGPKLAFEIFEGVCSFLSEIDYEDLTTFERSLLQQIAENPPPMGRGVEWKDV